MTGFGMVKGLDRLSTIIEIIANKNKASYKLKYGPKAEIRVIIALYTLTELNRITVNRKVQNGEYNNDIKPIIRTAYITASGYARSIC